MQLVTIVTGNPGKVKDIKTLANGKLDFQMHDLDLDEIQSLDLRKIIEHKAKQAFTQLNSPIVVEDVSAELGALNGLPGPFIKFFNKKLGEDALYTLSTDADRTVTIRCLAAYYDGVQLVIGEGALQGTLVSPRGEKGFGFDVCVVPEGDERTMAEMTPEEKAAISHRGKAFRDLLSQLEQILI